MDFAYLGSILLLIFGFGFVIFWHELGHFLAAKWAGVKVEQFAVGFGQAMLSWRKGLGVRVGSSRAEYETKLRNWLSTNETAWKDQREIVEASEDRRLDYAAEQAGIGETEYRLNWIPLGGYVKMLGQDDMDPNAISDHPRAYNKKPIYQRMVIVSAGVVMNVILAIILFTVLFRIGFDAPPPVIGGVLAGSPAQQAGLKVGDRVLYYDGNWQHDFTKIRMYVALSGQGQRVPIHVEHPDKTQETLYATPRRSDYELGGLLGLGIVPSVQLEGVNPAKLSEDELEILAESPVGPGERIVAIGGIPVTLQDYHVLHSAMQAGLSIQVTVENGQGAREDRTIKPSFVGSFDRNPTLNFAGMVPRAVVRGVQSWSSASGKLKSGDIIDQITLKPVNDQIPHPSYPRLMEALHNAGQQGMKVEVTVLRDGNRETFTDLDPSKRVAKDRRGLGIGLAIDEDHAVIAEILPDSAAARAGLPAGATINSIDGKPVQNWFDVHRAMRALTPGRPVKVDVTSRDGQRAQFDVELTAEQLASLQTITYAPQVALRELHEPRQTNNPFIAAGWGITETRDLIIQFYLTLRRMMERSISPSNMMGPLGIFHTGSLIAYRGTDWLIWFLAMISANLAVVNFLPIPIVDGGLFVFLLLEKIMGKPLSPKAQSIAQIVGLALIASVFLFVTYHDISRLIF